MVFPPGFATFESPVGLTDQPAGQQAIQIGVQRPWAQLRGWPAIAQFLAMPNSPAHRWAKEGMPVRREGRNVVASPEELNRWLQRTSGEAAGVHVVTPGSDLLKDLQSSLACRRGPRIFQENPRTDGQSGLRRRRAKRNARADPNRELSRGASQRRGDQKPLATSRCIQLSEDGDEAMPRGRASPDTMSIGLRPECLPAIW